MEITLREAALAELRLMKIPEHHGIRIEAETSGG